MTARYKTERVDLTICDIYIRCMHIYSRADSDIIVCRHGGEQRRKLSRFKS